MPPVDPNDVLMTGENSFVRLSTDGSTVASRTSHWPVLWCPGGSGHVLFIFSADKRHLHSQAIPKTVGAEILKDSNKEFYKSQTEGVLKMFKLIEARLSSASTTSTSQPVQVPQPKKPATFRSEYVLLIVAAVVIAFALFRTSKKPAPKSTRKS